MGNLAPNCECKGNERKVPTEDIEAPLVPPSDAVKSKPELAGSSASSAGSASSASGTGGTAVQGSPGAVDSKRTAATETKTQAAELPAKNKAPWKAHASGLQIDDAAQLAVMKIGWDHAMRHGTSEALPMELFEPCSLFERIASNWLHLTTFLPLAAAAGSDSIARMRHVVAFVVSGLHASLRLAKPFSPHLGETWQAAFADGTAVFFENVADLRPGSQCAFDVRCPRGTFRFSAAYGCRLLQTALPPKVVGSSMGAATIDFMNADGAITSSIQFEMPNCTLTGLLWGPPIFAWGTADGGPMRFVDRKTGVTAELNFDPDGAKGGVSLFAGLASFVGGGGGGGVAGALRTPAHTVRGVIRDADGKTASRFRGSWLRDLTFDGDTSPAWSLTRDEKSGSLPRSLADGTVCGTSVVGGSSSSGGSETVVASGVGSTGGSTGNASSIDVLPTDCRLRPDLRALAAGDIKLAQELFRKGEAEQKKRHHQQDLARAALLHHPLQAVD